MQENEACDWIEDGDVVLTFGKRAWRCAHGVLSPQDYDWKENKVIIKEKALEKRYGQRVLASACFGLTRKERFSFVMLKVKEIVEVVWFVKVVVVL